MEAGKVRKTCGNCKTVQPFNETHVKCLCMEAAKHCGCLMSVNHGGCACWTGGGK